jgi:diguanylate cyclase (GGDEF)-like protein/PAS domain S-box-containing protein
MHTDSAFMGTDDLLAINERLSQTLQSGSQLAFDWLIPGDRLHFTSGVPENFRHVTLNGINNSINLHQLMHDDDKDTFQFAVRDTINLDKNPSGILQHLQLRLRDTRVGWRWVEMSGMVVERDIDGRAVRCVGMFTDISARKEAEQRAARLLDLYSALRRTIHAILHMQNPESLFPEICRIAVEHANFHIATIRLLDPKTGLLNVVASHGFDQPQFEAVEVSIDPEKDTGRGPSGIAIRENRPSICNDFFGSVFPDLWKKVALELNLNSFASFPFWRGGDPIGVLILYSSEKNYFDDALVDLLQEMMRELSFALDNFDQEKRRAAMEIALAESEKLKDAIFLASLDCIVSFDDTGRIVDINPAAERTFGYRRREAIGRQLADLLIAPESRDLQRRNIAELLTTGDSPMINRRVELMATHASGMTFPIEIAVAPIEIADKRLFSAYIRDISELKQSQAILRDSEARYRQIIELSPDAIFVHRKNKFLLVNEACVKQLGMKNAEELLGKDVLPFVHPDYHEVVMARVRQLPTGLTNQAMFNDEVWVRADGTEFHAEIAATKFYYLGVPAIQNVMRDITTRKMTEQLQLAQNRILGMVASGLPLQEILLTLSRFVETHSTQGLCSIQIMDAGSALLHPPIAAGLPEEFCSAIGSVHTAAGDGCFSAAVRRRQRVTSVDMAKDPLWAPWRDLAVRHGLLACTSWPILGKQKKILGALSLYYRETHAPDTQELELADIAANLAGIAIENKQSEDRIRFLAHYDELTSLPNRSLFNQLLNHAMKSAQRHQSKLAVLFIDLDRFKNINDTLGHDAGDFALREFSKRVRGCMRGADTLARMGGDEFYVLIEELSDGGYASTVAQKILCEASQPFFIHGQECHLSASIGIAIYPDDGLDARSLLKTADIAMYRAKADGKNAFHFYAPGKNIHTIERLTLESQMRRAIDSGEFVLHYQPKIELATGRITGVEALVRWQHPEHGLLPPARFIPLAEETRLIIPLSIQILRIACRDALAINAGGADAIHMAVNLSPRQLDDGGFIDSIQSLLTDTGMPPHLLQLEITESMVMHNPEQAVVIMNQLRAMGIRLDIDDFGTGYSSLANLKRFPVYSLKIDQSFVKDIPVGPNDTAITKAIIAMGHSMSMRVVAEGVETVEQMEALRAFGCDDFQGFYFSRPVPLDEFLQLQKNHVAADWI